VADCIKDATELTPDEVGSMLDDVDGTRDTWEPILDELGNATDDMGDGELWLLIDNDTNAEVDSGEMVTLEATSGTWELDDTTVRLSSEGFEIDTEVGILTDDEMTSDKDVDIDVGMELLAVAVWPIPVPSKLLVDAAWTDPASKVLGLSTGKRLEIDSRTVEDTIGFVDTTGDDCTLRMLEVTSLLGCNTVGETAVEIIWGSSEVDTARDVLNPVCEIVLGSSTVVSELNETLDMIVSEGVCTGVTSSPDRLRLDVVLMESDDIEGNEVTRDSVTDREEVKPIGRVVEVTSRSVWLASGSEETAGVLVSRTELKAVGSVLIADASVKMEVEDETPVSEEAKPLTVDGVTKGVVTEDNAERSFVVTVEGIGSMDKLVVMESRSVWLVKDSEDTTVVSISETEVTGVGRISIGDETVMMGVGEETAMLEEVNPSTLDEVSRVAVGGDNVDGSISEIELIPVEVISATDVSAKMDVRDEVIKSEEGMTSALDEVSRDVVGEDNVGGSVGKSIAEPVGVSEMAGVDMALLKLLGMISVVDASVRMSVRDEMTTAGSVPVTDDTVKTEVGDKMTSSDEDRASTLDEVSKGMVAEDSVDESVGRATGSTEVSIIAEVDMMLLILLGRSSTADESAMMGVGDEIVISEENDTSMLDTISEDVGTGDNTDPTEVSRLAEDDKTLPTLPSTLDGISVEVELEDSRSVIDADIATLSEGVWRGVVASTESIWVAEAERREVEVMFGTSSSLALDNEVAGNSEDEA
jgi:hypothetical protein